MSNNKKIDNSYLNEYADNVIKRGYEIYDEWTDKRYHSKKIVALSDSAVKLFNKRKTKTAFIDALAYLFALDMRIKEKYNNIFRCLFSYFSWRRETRALSSLKSALNIPLGETDIRNVILIEIERLADKLNDEWNEDGDDDTHGGKRNGKSDEEASASEEKGKEQAKEEKAEKDTKAEKTEDKSEVKTEEASEKTDEAEPTQEKVEKKENVKHSEEKITQEAQDVKEQTDKEKQSETKEEKNIGAEEKSEPSKDKSNEARSYNDAVDYLPIYESAKESKHASSDDKKSIIDDNILDDMAKRSGSGKYAAHDRTNDVKPLDETQRTQDTVTAEALKDNSTDKDEYLYDKMIATDKDETQQTLDVESTKQAEKVSETKTEQPKVSIQNNDNVQSNEQELKSLSEMLQADLNVSLENQVIRELGNTMSDESRVAYAQMQMDMAREKLSITYAELGIDEPAEIIGMQEPVQVSEQSISPQRK